MDRKTEQALEGPATSINTRLLAASLDVREFWTHLRRQLIIGADPDSACADALRQAGCSEFQLEQTSRAITSLIRECRSGFNSRFPKLVEQLELRARPLKERWEAIGPGLLNTVEKRVWGDQAPQGWWPSKVSGLLVQPMRGGDGGLISSPPAIWVEAVLTDVQPLVPEVLRVGWLITRVAVECHLADKTDDAVLIRAWSLASIPLLLEAGRELDLIAADDIPLSTALVLWGFADDPDHQIVESWYREVGSTAGTLMVAIKDLHQRLQPAGPQRPQAGD